MRYLRGLATIIALMPAQFSMAQQESPSAPAAHDQAQTAGSTLGGGHVPWHFMQDGVVNLIANHQGGPRGGDEVLSTNWWMGMWSRPFDRRRLTLSTMFSLEPLTAGRSGYAELFQVGEALDGRPLIDRQHPHDVFMQLSAAWRTPVTDRTAVTLAVAAAGEPALGPAAFMHRASAAAILQAPLSHHLFDSTHISFGVMTASVELGPVTVEGSAFNGREPDENRWDLDLGRMDSASGRIWFRPSDSLTVQASVGRLVEPEILEPGDMTRRTVSASWWRPATRGFDAVTIGYGENAGHALIRQGVFAEATRQRGRTAISARLEATEVETNLLLGQAADEARADAVRALTVGATLDLFRRDRFEGAAGINVTGHATPEALRASHGARPLSFQVFLQIRPNTGAMGRMWNSVMGQER